MNEEIYLPSFTVLLLFNFASVSEKQSLGTAASSSRIALS